MEKAEQVLRIEPQNELRFMGPFSKAVNSSMNLENPSDKRVLFKIKTTAPKKYCVRPNSGILEPNQKTDICITLQPFVFDPVEKNKHKFMVQSLFAPEGEINAEALWKESNQDDLMDTKLKCVFEMPVDFNEPQDETVCLASPKVQSNAVDNSVMDSELQKAAEEVQQLREEESSLRQENLRLKEEVMQLKIASGQRMTQLNRYAPPPPQQNYSMIFVALSVVMAFVGILFGKYIL